MTREEKQAEKEYKKMNDRGITVHSLTEAQKELHNFLDDVNISSVALGKLSKRGCVQVYNSKSGEYLTLIKSSDFIDHF